MVFVNGKKLRTQGNHGEFYLDRSVSTLYEMSVLHAEAVTDVLIKMCSYSIL